jgi:hypothetical protein
MTALLFEKTKPKARKEATGSQAPEVLAII